MGSHLFVQHISIWLRLPGLGNNNEKLGLPERLKCRNTIPVLEPISWKNIGLS
jgi:hypothetical protein